MNIKKIPSVLTRIAATVGVTLGAFAIAAFAQWTAPPGTPPTCPSGAPGCDAPINVGEANQLKLGTLSINTSLVSPATIGLNVFGQSIFDSVKILTGAGAGKVLTSDATGNATWAAPAGAGGGINFSGAGVVYTTTINGNGVASFIKVNSAGARGVILNINKGGAECSDLKIELYSKAGSPPNLPTYAYGSEWGVNDTTQYQYLGYILGATRDGTTRQTGTVVTMPISPTGYIMLKSNTDFGIPCGIIVTKIADIY